MSVIDTPSEYPEAIKEVETFSGEYTADGNNDLIASLSIGANEMWVVLVADISLDASVTDAHGVFLTFTDSNSSQRNMVINYAGNDNTKVERFGSPVNQTPEEAYLPAGQTVEIRQKDVGESVNVGYHITLARIL